jgi:glutathione synthase/RimK-type ligase-like ATP-grasp enzyme
MTLAIHHSNDSYSERWIIYCEVKQIAYKKVNCYANDIVQQLEGCSALLWHHHQGSAKDIVFGKQLLFAMEQAGLKVFPDFKTGWHFDDKVGQKYLLEALHIPLVPSHVFYSKATAIEWVNKTSFPKVFKLRGGAGSANVSLAHTKAEAIKLVKQAFGSGFSQYQPYTNLKERIRKYRAGKTDLKNVGKGLVRFVYPPEFSKVSGKERGYIYFQDFIANNDHDIRVIIIGDKAFAIKRMVRNNDFRASGSGFILYEKELFDDATIQLSFDIAAKLSTQVVALDFVFIEGKPLVVEISYGFSMAGYDPCPGYWDSNLHWHQGQFNPYGWMIDDLIKSIG